MDASRRTAHFCGMRTDSEEMHDRSCRAITRSGKVYPFALFFAPDGYYVRHCKQAAASVAGKSTPAVSKAGLASVTTTIKERKEARKKAKAAKTLTSVASTVSTATTTSITPTFCGNYIAKLVKGPGATGCTRGKFCRFSHDRNVMKMTPRADVLAQLQALKGLQGGEETRNLIAQHLIFFSLEEAGVFLPGRISPA